MEEYEKVKLMSEGHMKRLKETPSMPYISEILDKYRLS
jgi:hypothetical protein